VGRTTFSGYLEILEDTLLAFRLPAFEAKLRLRERKHPKLYWVDPGLVRAAGNRPGERHPQERGTLFEGFIANVLRACRDLQGLGKRILVYPGERMMKTADGIDIWPLSQFTHNLNAEYLWNQ
jgi:predicted AAA+ superfamily ATPase